MLSKISNNLKNDTDIVDLSEALNNKNSISDIKKSLEKYTQFLNFIAYKYKIDFDKLTKDLEEFSFEEKDNFSIIEIKEKNLPHTLINKNILRSIA